jgi:hypothetical protein
MNLNHYETVAKEIIDLDPKDPNYFRTVQAKIKRFVHEEKYSLMHRIALAGKGNPEFALKMVESKRDGHEKMMKMSDDELITW